VALIEPVICRLELPPGAAGPDAISIDVRSFVVPHAAGVVLVDVGPPDSSAAIEAALARVGRTWTDVTDIVLTHAHFDHVGGLAQTADNAPSALLWAGAADAAAIEVGDGSVVKPLNDGDRVRDLRVLDTPGHTAGHISLFHEAGAILFVGDLVGSVGGALSSGPEAFTADPRQSRRSLARIANLPAERILFSHGPEIPDAHAAIADFLAS
jgi:glyoxylase-like metal-dependent hydrolase (beta-lactamase superfamily II)